MDIAQLNEKIKNESAFIDLLFSEIGKVIVGQKEIKDTINVLYSKEFRITNIFYLVSCPKGLHL